MLTKTIAFGTKLRGKVTGVSGSKLLFVYGADGETYVLYGTQSNAKEDDRGTLEFRPGGPFGGFWHFTPDEDQEASA